MSISDKSNSDTVVDVTDNNYKNTINNISVKISSVTVSDN